MAGAYPTRASTRTTNAPIATAMAAIRIHRQAMVKPCRTFAGRRWISILTTFPKTRMYMMANPSPIPSSPTGRPSLPISPPKPMPMMAAGRVKMKRFRTEKARWPGQKCPMTAHATT